MGELGNVQESAATGIGSVPPMSSFEKARFWAVPSVLFILSLFWIAISALSAAALLFEALHGGQHGWAAIVFLVILAFAVAAFSHSISAFRKTIRRKRNTGNFMPAGEELAAFRIRWKNPGMWVRAYTVGVFSLFAFGDTRDLLSSPHYSVVYWPIPLLMWAVAILVAIECFSPSPKRIWAALGIAGAYGLTALFSAGLLLHRSEARFFYWSFPLIMAALSAYFAPAAFRSRGQSKQA